MLRGNILVPGHLSLLQGIELGSPALQADSLPAEPQGNTKYTGVGSLSLLQGIFPTQESNWGLLHCRQILYQLSYRGAHPSHLKVQVQVTQSCLTLCDPVDLTVHGIQSWNTVHGIRQAKILEWVAFPFFRGYSQPRDQTQVSSIAGRFFTS